MSGFQEWTLGPGSTARSSRTFHGKEGHSYRVSFVWLSDDRKPRFTGCERHYLQGVGYFLHKGPEFSELAGGPPVQAVATIIVVWPTDDRGRLDVDVFKRGEGHRVLPWLFNEKTYDVIKRRHDSFPLQDCDETLTCTDTQYQKFDISPEKDSLYNKLAESANPRAKAIVEGIAAEVVELEKGMRDLLARDLTVEQVQHLIAGRALNGSSHLV